MEATVRRLFIRGAAQFGVLSFFGEEPSCFTLEDVPRVVKVPRETCIAGGRYELKLRTFGRLYELYRTRYPWNEPGMLWLQAVPQFSDVLIHCGTTDKHTSGCLLLGDRADLERPSLAASVTAYQRVYSVLARALLNGERSYIDVKELGR